MPSLPVQDPAVPTAPSVSVRVMTPATPAAGSVRPHTFKEYGDRRVVTWTVQEIDCTETPGACKPRCLVFDAETMFRRVYDYPPEWATLPDAALVVLSWRR